MKTVNIDRLEKICNTKLNVFQQNAIYEWGKEYAESVNAELKRQYIQEYQDDLIMSVDNFIIAIAFVLHFSEKLKLGKKRLYEILTEIQATVDMFNKKGEYTPKDYQKMLADDGIKIKMNWDKE